MKKYILFILIFLFSLPVFAETFFGVEWSEICPKRYQNINTDSPHLTSQGRYWAERKRTFDKRLAKCDSLTEEQKGACYDKLRSLEIQVTELHNEENRNRILKYMLINSF